MTTNTSKILTYTLYLGCQTKHETITHDWSRDVYTDTTVATHEQKIVVGSLADAHRVVGLYLPQGYVTGGHPCFITFYATEQERRQDYYTDQFRAVLIIDLVEPEADANELPF